MPFIDSKIMMLCVAQECVCGGALAGTERPRHQQLSGSRSSVVAQMPKTRQSPAHANSAETSYSLHVGPRSLSRISGQHYRQPVLNKKRTVALIHPLSKTEKPPFNEIYHINCSISVHSQKGKQCAPQLSNMAQPQVRLLFFPVPKKALREDLPPAI